MFKFLISIGLVRIGSGEEKQGYVSWKNVPNATILCTKQGQISLRGPL